MDKMCLLVDGKICDNCMKCVNSGADYAAIEIDDIEDPEDAADEN